MFCRLTVLRAFYLFGAVLLLAACGRDLPDGVQEQPEALVITGWSGLHPNAPTFVVTGMARDSVLAVLRRHSDSTGVALRDYLVETDQWPRGTASGSGHPLLRFTHSRDDIVLLKRAVAEIAEQTAAGRDTTVTLMPIGYHSLIIHLNASADSVISVWSPYFSPR